jgi:hypothetical protein
VAGRRGGDGKRKRDASIKETSPLSLTKLPVYKIASEKVNGGPEGPPSLNICSTIVNQSGTFLVCP